MFKVNEYKIVFKRVWHTDDEGESLRNGRYDTMCSIYVNDLEVPRFAGAAKLHPNDKPDKIIGKKIALWDAMSQSVSFNRTHRTTIWKAFWEWVGSWRTPKRWELYEEGTPSERAEIIAEIRRLHKTTVWQPPIIK